MKRQNLWNEDAWSELSSKRKEIDPSVLSQQLKRSSPDHSRANIQDNQLRAEFSDFNVDGLRKFQNSKKYINPISFGAPTRDLEFGPPISDREKNLANDFLNWDMGSVSNKSNPSQSTPTQDFTEFNFGSSVKQEVSTPFDHDIFSQTGQPKSTSEAGGSFWDLFGQPAQPKNAAHLHSHSDMAAHPIGQSGTNPSPFDPFSMPATGDASSKSTLDQLLELNLGPADGSKPKAPETTVITSAKNPTDKPQDSVTGTLSHESLTPQNKPMVAPQGGNSLLELNIG